MTVRPPAALVLAAVASSSTPSPPTSRGGDGISGGRGGTTFATPHSSAFAEAASRASAASALRSLAAALVDGHWVLAFDSSAEAEAAARGLQRAAEGVRERARAELSAARLLLPPTPSAASASGETFAVAAAAKAAVKAADEPAAPTVEPVESQEEGLLNAKDSETPANPTAL